LFALIGFAASTMLGWTVFVQWRPEQPAFAKEIPQGKFKVVQLTYASGSALTGGLSCVDKVSVLPTSLDSAQATEARFQVFVADCASFADHSPSPKIEWLTDSSIKITASIDSTALVVTPVNMRKSDVSGTVRIQFEAYE
jgi:hypothetical protein